MMQEAEKTPSSKRKPLSDCTNTVATTRRKSSTSSAKSAAKTIINLPKPSISAVFAAGSTTITTADKCKRSSHNSSRKSLTSTGSSISANVRCVVSDLPASSTPLSASGGQECRKSRTHGVQSRKQAAKSGNNKGKTVLETLIIQASTPLSGPAIASPAASGSHLCALPAFQIQNPEAQTKEDNGKKDFETPDIVASDTATPRTALIVSSVSASGIHDQDRMELSTVYDQKSVPRRRKHAGVEIVLSLSCPCEKRMRKKGMGLGNDGDAKQSGTQTDPLPVHKKKRFQRKHDVSPEEIERLKAYYADVDAFELPEEEVTSERDLD